jgi:phosphohistidine phosphatase
MDLFIIRHAGAGHFGDPAWPNDAERPLTDEGRKRFVRMVKKLADGGLAVDLIATSPMVRCVQTAEALAEHMPGHPEVVSRDELLSGGSLEELLAWTNAQAADHGRIAWVGHAPHVGQWTAALVGPGGSDLRFGKGTVAAVRFEEAAQAGGGELRWLVTAKVLGC